MKKFKYIVFIVYVPILEVSIILCCLLVRFMIIAPFKKDKNILFVVARKRTGPTGGGGGVQFLCEKLLGHFREFEGAKYAINYCYADPKRKFSNVIIPFGFERSFVLRSCLRLLVSVGYVFKYGRRSELIVAHDVISAFSAYILRLRYVLVYHQQGESLWERSNLNNDLSTLEKLIFAYIQRRAIKNCIKVYFPSSGGEYSFIQTGGAALLRGVERGVLYNTVTDSRVGNDIESIDNLSVDVINGLKQSGYLIAYSVGALTEAKGVHDIPGFIENLENVFNKKIFWIVVGRGDKESALVEEIGRAGIKKSTIVANYRVEHSDILLLAELSDLYLMCHKYSIFDFATLEAMRAGCALVLSCIPGNTDFNKDQNVLFFESLQSESYYDLGFLKEKNNETFLTHFSGRCFVNNYEDMISENLFG